jgi:hypothetical protein
LDATKNRNGSRIKCVCGGGQTLRLAEAASARLPSGKREGGEEGTRERGKEGKRIRG